MDNPHLNLVESGFSGRVVEAFVGFVQAICDVEKLPSLTWLTRKRDR